MSDSGERRWVVWLVGALVCGCGRSSAAPGAARAEAAPVGVETVVASVRPMPRVVQLTGQLVGTQETRLASNAPGRVLATSVERGDQVKAGQLLARLDTRAAALSAAEARASLASLELRQAQARVDCARVEALVQSGAVATAVAEPTRLACAQAPADRAAAQARAQMAQLDVGNGAVVAPFAGFVTERHVSAGAYVQPGSALVSLVNLDRLRLEVAVPEAQLGALQDGVELRFSTPAYPGQTFVGSLRARGYAVRAASRDVVVDADVVNLDHRLLPGMFAAIDLPLAASPAVVVPADALVERDGRWRAFVLAGDRVEERVVLAGAEADGVRAVMRGLTEGERVVRGPRPELRNGQRAVARVGG